MSFIILLTNCNRNRLPRPHQQRTLELVGHTPIVAYPDHSLLGFTSELAIIVYRTFHVGIEFCITS